ncbi:Gp19/Gp15/Gp42 family protein [Propionimicrobium sp. PCR01-08-3]|uniref:Gp19/Gp15/Gp42 family protein n=1 Tax=Propionimicrobium sp. PCR01-08-3 TaxID=3052086 RepID=UPI00255CDCA7|nr:Gp19/Gp15/Gp42 family protein [Propionimicrobium sp. PCR01-08-3]WIY84329.1 Gp19/Gp15/Gp42 family protein [Propionimicrobium sp. PCR01-08-3]
MEPFATADYYTSNGFGAPFDHLDAMLARASRIVRAETTARGYDIDQLIADGRVDHNLVADIVCDMVAYAQAGPGVGVNSIQQTTGPFQKTFQYATSVGSLSFTKVHWKRLGLGGQGAFEVDLLKGSRDG